MVRLMYINLRFYNFYNEMLKCAAYFNPMNILAALQVSREIAARTITFHNIFNYRTCIDTSSSDSYVDNCYASNNYTYTYFVQKYLKTFLCN